MEPYDAMFGPDPQAWLALDEQERIDLALTYHRRIRFRLPKDRLRFHALLHAVVETQIAMGDQAASERTLKRLMREGLDRHEAVHAIGSEVAWQIAEITQGKAPPGDPNEVMAQRLGRLTAKSWRESWNDES